MKRLAFWVVRLGAVVAIAALLGPALIAWREDADGRALPAGVPGRLLDVGGRRVHIVEHGEGAPLLLVHGFGASTFDFEEFALEPLARSRRAIAVDLFGFGWSERSDDFHYGWTLWSDQLAGTLDALGIERASVVGHSMGGAVAAVFAARYPTRIDKLILLDALYPSEPGEIPLVFQALRTPILGEVALGLVADASAPGFSAAHRARALPWQRIHGTRAAALRYVRDPHKRAGLIAAYPRIAAPTLILHGTADQNVLYAAMQRAAPAIRTARIVPLEGGHFPLRDAPDVVVREVESHLAAP